MSLATDYISNLGSSDIVKDEDKTLVEQMLYRPYGTELDPGTESGGTWDTHLENVGSRIPNEKTHHRFTGHYLDDETGLYYFGARYYSAELGRFCSADGLFVGSPEECVGSPLECGLYWYAGNNPLKYVDPSGARLIEAAKHLALGVVNMWQLKETNGYVGVAGNRPNAGGSLEFTGSPNSEFIEAKLETFAGGTASQSKIRAGSTGLKMTKRLGVTSAAGHLNTMGGGVANSGSLQRATGESNIKLPKMSGVSPDLSLKIRSDLSFQVKSGVAAGTGSLGVRASAGAKSEFDFIGPSSPAASKHFKAAGLELLDSALSILGVERKQGQSSERNQ